MLNTLIVNSGSNGLLSEMKGNPDAAERLPTMQIIQGIAKFLEYSPRLGSENYHDVVDI